MKSNFIDFGSSTIKFYKYINDKLVLIEEKSIYMKNDFSSEKGISLANKKEMYEYFSYIIDKYSINNDNTAIYATGIFRKINDNIKDEFVKEFYGNTKIDFNIISHDEENRYLELAMNNNYNNKKVLIINMGGKTTELITFVKGEVIDRRNIEVGVAELMNKFPNVNDEYSSVDIKEIVDYTNDQITDSFGTDYDCAIFTGGELRFEKLTGYKLEKNTLFDDSVHDLMVTYDNFLLGNQRIFFDLTMNDLYDLMPHNPKWMDGARVGAILPQAIVEKCNIKYIIPSDLNLINGVIKDLINN